LARGHRTFPGRKEGNWELAAEKGNLRGGGGAGAKGHPFPITSPGIRKGKRGLTRGRPLEKEL